MTNIRTLFVYTAFFLVSITLTVYGQSGKIASANSTVEVVFNVIIPLSTSGEDVIYLYGSMNNWDAGPNVPPDSSDLPMDFRSGSSVQFTLLLQDRTKYEYKYTRGSLETVENNTDSTDSEVRSIFVNSELTPFIVNDTVHSWTDFTQPQNPENVSPVLSYFNSSPQTSIAISWATDSATTNRVMIGKEDSDLTETDISENLDMINPGDKLIHNVLISDLEPGTAYKYKVISDGVYESPELTFKTAEYTDKFEFAVLGDNRPGIDTSVMRRIIADESSFVIHLGDLVQYGLDLDNWFTFLSDYRDMLGTIPTMAIYGNHENDAYLNKFFRFPTNGSADSTNHGHWYSFNYNNVHIIVLDPYRDYEAGSEQYNWLINDLVSVPDNIDHVFVMIHEPPFTSGSNHGPNLDIREKLVPVFQEYKVDMVFSGHEHIYERSVVDGVPYIVSGGAGSPLYFVASGLNEYSIIAESVYHYCRVYIDGKKYRVEMVRSNGIIGDVFENEIEETNIIPEKIDLDQNYPNPFNPKTTIRYSLTKDGFVNLAVFDVLGREVMDLVNGNRNAGVYEADFFAGNLSSGVYLYRLTTGGKSIVRKMMVLK